MLQNFNEDKSDLNTASSVLAKINYIVGNQDRLENIKYTYAYEPFAEDVIEFFDNLSKALLSNRKAKKFSDVITFAFWCRRASMEKMKQNYQGGDECRLGRGIIFHIAPSNVALNFAYSMAVGLLAGNANIVRLPSKEFEQVGIICTAINEVLEDYSNLKPYFVIVKYDYSQTITDTLSLICDIRVIWGGNQTINTIRKSALNPRATEICFADRYSISVINADTYLEMPDKKVIAQKFYNDTYLNDQNACTSPKLVVWMGERVKIAQETFWKELHSLIIAKYEIQAVQIVDKLVALYKVGAVLQEGYDARFVSTGNDNLITRVKIQKISPKLIDSSYNSGFFFEYVTGDLKSLLPICRTGLQTISVLGVSKEEILKFIKDNRPKGIDRVVTIGETLDFDLIWDGYDLINQMSRAISLMC